MSRRNIRLNARRLRDTITRTEQDPYATAGGPGDPRIGFPLLFAKTTTSITAASGDTPGAGDVKIMTFDGTSFEDGTGDDIHVYNYAASTVATGKKCWLAPWGGYMFIISAEC
jgi:hypothetical protein